MLRRVLIGAGFVEGETFNETQFITPPRTTYAVFHDSFTRRGADYYNLLKEHDGTIELYSDFPDPEAEARIENMFDNLGLEYDKSERYWIEDEQLYQVVYTFNYIEK